jgi:hypothetical protein
VTNAGVSCGSDRRSGRPKIGRERQLFFNAVDILTVLMKHKMGDLALIVFEKLELCVDNFIEEFCVRFGEDSEFRLTCGLGHQLTAVERNHNTEFRT